MKILIDKIGEGLWELLKIFLACCALVALAALIVGSGYAFVWLCETIYESGYGAIIGGLLISFAIYCIRRHLTNKVI